MATAPGPAAASGRRQAQRGQLLPLFAALLVVLCVLTGLAVEVSALMGIRRALQGAADAMALAGAQDLPNKAAATDTVNGWAAKNGVDATEILSVDIVDQELPAEPNPRIHIQLQRSHALRFLSLLGFSSVDVTATASAIRTSPGGTVGSVPWGVLDDVLANVSPGERTVLKYDARGVSNGNFGALAVDGKGAGVYEDGIKYGTRSLLCAVGAAGCTGASVVQTEPGNMTGPTRRGVAYRIDNTDSACSSWTQVVLDNGRGRHTLNPACNPFAKGGSPDSLRIVVVPLIGELCRGSCNVMITGFALFFLEGYDACTGNDCEVAGRYIGGDINIGATAGVFDATKPLHFVRLVQ